MRPVSCIADCRAAAAHKGCSADRRRCSLLKAVNSRIQRVAVTASSFCLRMPSHDRVSISDMQRTQIVRRLLPDAAQLPGALRPPYLTLRMCLAPARGSNGTFEIPSATGAAGIADTHRDHYFGPKRRHSTNGSLATSSGRLTNRRCATSSLHVHPRPWTGQAPWPAGVHCFMLPPTERKEHEPEAYARAARRQRHGHAGARAGAVEGVCSHLLSRRRPLARLPRSIIPLPLLRE